MDKKTKEKKNTINSKDPAKTKKLGLEGKEENFSTEDFITKNSSKNTLYITFIAIISIVIGITAGYYIYKYFAAENMVEISSKMKQKKDLVSKIRGLESEVTSKQNEIFKLMDAYKAKTGKDLPSANAMNLSKEEKAILQQKINQEKDVSMKTLLNDILQKNSEISKLQKKILELEELLPKPYIVRKGENHYQIAMNFLMSKKGIDKKTAMKLVERSALFEPLVPGFKVWNFYSNKEYGTFVTQGKAAVSPNHIRRTAKKKLVDARDQAISERDKLAEDIKFLEKKRSEIISHLDLLNKEKEKLLADNAGLQTSINSVSYILGTKKDLKEAEIIKGGFLKSTKLNEIDPQKYTKSMDLRISDRINISAEKLNLEKIKNIKVYPKIYKRDKDYKVTIAQSKKLAIVEFIGKEKYRKARIVISVE